MILQLKKTLSIEQSRCVLISDMFSDIWAFTAVGIDTNQLFAAGRPNELDGLNYELISTLTKAIPYLQRGVR